MDVAVSRALSRALFDPDRRHIAHVSPTMLVAGHDDAETIERLAARPPRCALLGDEFQSKCSDSLREVALARLPTAPASNGRHLLDRARPGGPSGLREPSNSSPCSA
jgi:hypothetical protein